LPPVVIGQRAKQEAGARADADAFSGPAAGVVANDAAEDATHHSRAEVVAAEELGLGGQGGSEGETEYQKRFHVRVFRFDSDVPVVFVCIRIIGPWGGEIK
jgi:hypothetical protein